MLFETAMMKRWMGIKSRDGIAASMKVMMPIMSKRMGPGAMADMMPEMMEGSIEMMQPEDMERMMHDAMPRMMESCFSRMEDEQRRSMLSMCRRTLDQVEEKFLGTTGSKDKKAR